MALSTAHTINLDDRMINECWIGGNMEGNSRGRILDTISSFLWTDWEKLQKLEPTQLVSGTRFDPWNPSIRRTESLSPATSVTRLDDVVLRPNGTRPRIRYEMNKGTQFHFDKSWAVKMCYLLSLSWRSRGEIICSLRDFSVHTSLAFYRRGRK